MATIMYHDHPYAGGLTEPVSADEVVYGDSNVEDELDKLNSVTDSMLGNPMAYTCSLQTGSYNVFTNNPGLYLCYIDCQCKASGGSWNLNLKFYNNQTVTHSQEHVALSNQDWGHQYCISAARCDKLVIDINQLPTDPSFVRVYYLRLKP